jgi:hypothetical protein
VRALLTLVAALIALALPGSARALDAPVPTCTPAPADCSGWYRTNVTVSWTWSGTVGTCTFITISADTAGTDVSCSSSSGSVTQTTTVTIRRDSTAPQVTGSAAARGPDSGGWYNHPVAVGFSGTDALSGVASCTSPTYGGGDGASVSVSGTCTDVAGNTSAPASFTLRYDATPPAVAAAADRRPDGRDWYRHPVTITFSGSDATSGLAGCTEPTRYAGPDRAAVEVAGGCRDAAGNAAEVKVQLRYDATAPAVAAARARLERGTARVTWRRPADAALIELERTPGVNGRRSTVVYQGRGESFVDRSVREGAVYRYEIRAVDAAGNVGRSEVSTGRASPLHRPAAGTTVRGGVTLAWAAAPGARFYNVQLYRGGKKVLSAWPKGPTLRLGRTWVYDGRPQRLEPGLYRWFVWPARGTRERPTYGRVLGSSTFRVAR